MRSKNKMKFNIKYFYLILGLLVVGMITYFVVAKEVEKSKQNQMPDDEVHRNLMQQRSTQMDKELLAKIDSLKKIISQNPKDSIALNHLGFFLLQAHKFDEAEKYFEDLLDLNPKRVDVLNVLAELNFNLKKFEKSENYIKKLLLIEKDNEVAQYNLGVVYVMQGRKDEAKKVWNALINKNPDSDMSKMAKESIQALQ